MSRIACAEDALLDRTVHVDIPPQQLTSALIQLSKQAGIQVLMSADAVSGVATQGVHGDMPLGAALGTLLGGTKFGFHAAGVNTIGVDVPKGTTDQLGTKSGVASDSNGGVRLAQAEQTVSAGKVAAEDGRETTGQGKAVPSLEEIVVTAQKKEERLQDVPVPVTVLNAYSLSDTNKVSLQDYYASVPGLTVAPNELNAQLVTIRGITTGGYTNPTVSVTIDDVPFVGATNSIGGYEVPDVDPGDLDHIEVLRGPQGTLYGANSLGGLIKYVTKDPSTDRFSARVSAGANGVRNGSEEGYDLRGAVNVPITDSLAIRASAFTRQEPGYIDNPVLNSQGVNRSQAYGARLSVLWRPLDDFTAKFSAVYQDVTSGGSNDVITGLGDLQQNFIAGTGEMDTALQAYTATLNYNIGSINLTSVTGYINSRFHDIFDYTPYLGAATLQQFGVTGTPYREDNDFTKITQDLRLALPLGRHFELLLGGFYTHESTDQLQLIGASNPAGYSVGQWWNDAVADSYGEYSAYADLTYHITEKLDLQLGARDAQTKIGSGPGIETGPYDSVVLLQPSPIIVSDQQARASAFTYLVTGKYKMTPDSMLYARVASGYRPGGTNALQPSTPPTYGPDKTTSYEVGLKADFLSRRVSIDASVYYIDWQDIQLQTRNPAGRTYYVNGGGAKSEGLELALELRPLSGLTISSWFSYDDAELTDALPAAGPLYGVAGARLPESSRYSANADVNEAFPIWGNSTGFIGGEVSYVGDREGVFTATPNRQVFPAYTKVDLRAGVNFEGGWTASLYANNVTDERGLLNGGLGYFYPFAYVYIKPRTVGLNLTKVF